MAPGDPTCGLGPRLPRPARPQAPPTGWPLPPAPSPAPPWLARACSVLPFFPFLSFFSLPRPCSPLSLGLC